MDQVLCNFLNGADKAVGGLFIHAQKDTRWEKIGATKDFWANLEWMPGAKKLWQFIQRYDAHRFPLNLPHHYEDIFHERNNNGVRQWGDDILCAVPKNIIWMHEQPQTETNLNK